MKLETLQVDNNLLADKFADLVSRRAPDPQFRHKPNADKWSVEEIIHHAILAGQSLGQLLDRLIVDQAAEQTPPTTMTEVPIAESLTQADFYRSIHAVPAASGTEPGSNFSADRLLGWIRQNQASFERQVLLGRQHDLRFIKTDLSVFTNINYYDLLYLILTHAQSHWRQIEELPYF